jgi:hypothetical protein
MATAMMAGKQVEVATVKIKGKDYVTVAERVRLAHELGGYSMESSEVFQLGDTGRYFARVVIRVGDATYTGTAEAKLNARPGSADGDSPIECAETSALGRALGFAGIGVLDGIASANEVYRNVAQAA